MDDDVPRSEARGEPDSVVVASADAGATCVDVDTLGADAAGDAEVAAVKSVSLLRTADVIDDSRPRSRNAVRYSLKAVSERMSGCEGFCTP